MADIELVIRINKESYEQIIEAGDLDYLEVITAIENGTPLPENHGRLIDADALECEPYLISKGNGMYEEVKGYFNIDETPTILEATEGEE